MFRLCAAIAIVAGLSFALRAESDFDKLQNRYNQAISNDNATGVGGVLAVLAEASGKAVNAPQFAIRRPLELLMMDIQEAMPKFSSPEAIAALASNVGKLAPDALAVVCFGLKAAPANEALDAAVLKALQSTQDFRVKIAAMEMLGAHKYVPAVERISALAKADEMLMVQIEACRALSQIPDKKSVPALIKLMQETRKKGQSTRPLYEATGALRNITGLKFIADSSSWLDWWSKNEATFQAEAKGTPTYNYELGESAEMSYYEIPLFEQRIVFVLDTSGSMEFGGTPTRFEKATTELSQLIGRLNDKQYFNIVTFDTDVQRWQVAKPLVQALDGSKKAAQAFIKSLKPKGGTNTTGVMEEVIRQVAAQTACETVFLVSDGAPNPWKQGLKSEQQARHITWINQCYKVRIHTVGIFTRNPAGEKIKEDQDDMKAFLELVAQKNDGSFKEVK